jgi:hypothetical protein
MSERAHDEWSAIIQRVQQGVREHSPTADSVFYNGGTVVVLAATSAAAFLGPVDLKSWEWVPAVLSGLAAFLVGLERALNFGERWRHQLAMRAGYEHILDQIDFLKMAEGLPEDERDRYQSDILSDLRAMRAREGLVPGAGTPTGPSAA